MQEHENVALAGFRPLVHLARAPSWRRDDTGIRRARAKFLSEAKGAVGAASVNDDNLGKGGHRETCKRPWKASFFVQGRDDDGDRHQGSRRGFFGLDEHEVHDNDDGDPEEDLLVPKQDFSILKQA